MPTYWNPGPAPPPGVRIPLGKAHVVRPGNDVTVISYSRTVGDCAAAADALAKEGVSVELVDLRTVAPYDIETVLASVARTRRAVIVHEAVKPFGVGAEIAARISEELFGQLRAPVKRVGANFAAVPFAKPLEAAHVPTQAHIMAAIKVTLK
jgi:pyruvate dehydrogenase E1 component beta subunit